MNNDLIVVGIGASAGGLEAINEFFDNIGARNGMAFVVVQHLSPDFKSVMDELLAKHTNLPIHVIDQNKVIRADNIYLIDKNSQIIIKDGQLVPIERDRSSYLNLPIDEFFHSLGKNYKKKGVGIILSGTGTDGSRGIRTLKENGGLIFAQDPETARFDGMPKAAIMTGLVDKVLSPKSIAETLQTLSVNGYTEVLDEKNKKSDAENSFVKSILNEIRVETGIDFSNYRRSTILRRIEKRIFITEKKDLKTYTEFLSGNKEEIETLHREFLIGVTCFFRDQEAFDLLEENYIPQIFENKPLEEPVRIWIPGCASGEEAYSIAILIEEWLRKTKEIRNYKIFATDLDANNILAANLGIYGSPIEKDIDQDRLSRYFTKTEDGKYKILKRVREKIVFSVHDALHDPPFINMDLISCRNLLIYLNPSTQQELLGNFQFALKYKGYLFLGPSETLGKMKPAFLTLDERWNIFQNKVEGRLYPMSNRRNRFRKSKYSLHHTRNTIDKEPQENMPFRLSSETYSRMLIQRYAPACLIVDNQMNLLYANGDVDEVLQFPSNPSDLSLSNMIDSGAFLALKNGVQKVVRSKRSHLYKGLAFTKKSRQFLVDAQFERIRTHIKGEELYLIELTIKDRESQEKSKPVVVDDEVTILKQNLKMLEAELEQTKEEELTLKERLEATNEELQTANEELLATNEELQSTNEELQSVNEELYSVNSELQSKVTELTIANNDLDNLLRSTDLGTIYVDKDLKIRKFTTAIARQFDLVESDIGRQITTFGNNIKGTNVYEDMVQVMKEYTKLEKEITDEDGNIFLMQIMPYKADNKVEGAIATFVDMSETKSAQEEIQSLADQFKAVFHYSSERISIYDPQGILLDINHGLDDYKSQLKIGKHLNEVVPEDTLVPIKNAFRKAVREKKMAEVGMDMTTTTGEQQWINVIFVPIFKDKKVIKVLKITRDETKIKTIEKKIRLQARIFSSIYRFSGEHILILNDKGVVQDINFTDAGYNKHEILGKSLPDLGPAHLESKIREILKKVVHTRTYSIYETDFVDDKGNQRYYINKLMPIIKDDNLEALVLLSRDITKPKTAEHNLKLTTQELEKRVKNRNQELQEKNNELEAMNSFMDSFVHGAAHDLRSPLTNIKGFLELLPDINNEKERTDIINHLTDAVHRMERVLAGLIELIDFQKTDIPLPRDLNIKKMVNQTLTDLNPYLEKAKGHVNIDIDPDISINYIEAYLSSALYNLLHNAIKYRSYDRPLSINISAAKENGTLKMIVGDNGIGMDLRRYGHFLFKPFKRLTIEREGTGIGLSIINKVVKRNGGRIEVESELNKGTTFTVFFNEYET